MLKKTILLFLIMFPAIAMADKFGVIDTDRLLQSLPEVKAVELQLQNFSEQYEEDFNALKRDMNRKYTELQRLPQGTMDEIVKRRVQEIQELDQKINQFRQTADTDLRNHETALMAPIRERIAEAIRQVGDEGGFVMIFEDTSPVYVRGDVVDVTDLVLSKMKTVK
ncbi:MAG: OmpH family outer membrane protein [Bacteroides sp.]|nr:OmpH family outer membrane protein [Bacteroides sp.]MCM1414146.1 OmpH family outer membrane protein [Bacteroides sp.]MCM1471012.1 OmpH family outer membrane protein [Bacteroides sp.]